MYLEGQLRFQVTQNARSKLHSVDFRKFIKCLMAICLYECGVLSVSSVNADTLT